MGKNADVDNIPEPLNKAAVEAATGTMLREPFNIGILEAGEGGMLLKKEGNNAMLTAN